MTANALLSRFEEDPLSRLTAPPANETPEAKKLRLEAEAQAKKQSDAIDEELNRQRVAERKWPRPIKVLLLGQSESGKSTTLKNFQLMHSPKVFRAECASWRAVIQLNVVRSILFILNAMSDAPTELSWPGSPSSSKSRASQDLPPFTAEHMKLKMRLSPLIKLENQLRRQLAPEGSVEFEATQFPQSSTPFPIHEVAINSNTPWKSAFGKLLPGGGRESLDGEDTINWDDPHDPGLVLNACSEDMVRLWNDPVVKAMLSSKGLRLEEMAGFFLDSLERVTAARYVPTDDDILRARLKTMGVSEHRFEMDEAAWVPFFEDVDTIIFLAPISCFDQVLQEDKTVNRLEDSYNLYKAVVSNMLLRHTNIVLFLNKIDILQAKLANGVLLRKYVVSYGDRPNDYENVSAYLKRKFGGILKESSPYPRIFYAHFTAVTDTRNTSLILANVKDMLMRQNLQATSLI
ncbi:hypothetical protein HGRIS_000565 [Hohenbuehelia grisea]|uniref:Guanine nucleotide-binding protein alpha-4 subunit n=1 Tax=Hohenbuehelia grisea TaxID=104357 RepID=A0ABR3JTC7_9AGAR